MRVLVLKGGAFSEREVSLRSGACVEAALTACGYEVFSYDPIDGFDGLDQFVGKVDVCLPILHGVGGEDGTAQKELDNRHIKYLGAGIEASELCINKIRLKEIAVSVGARAPKGELVDWEGFKRSELIMKPFVLKPLNDGSSIDTLIVRDAGKIPDVIHEVFKRREVMLLEELIQGTEITVGILGDSALPVIEIVPPDGQEFDYLNKYNGLTRELCPAESISQMIQENAQALALKIHQAAGVRHLSRTDMIVSEAGDLYVLDTNTLPGLTNQSLYPKAAAAAGISFENLVQRFVEMTAE